MEANFLLILSKSLTIDSCVRAPKIGEIMGSRKDYTIYPMDALMSGFGGPDR